MARHLLGLRHMKLWALVPLLAASGCLYLDRINDPPTISLGGISVTSGVKGATFSLNVRTADDEDPPAKLKVLYHVYRVLDPTDPMSNNEPLDPDCNYEVSEGYGWFRVQLFRTGMYVVEADAYDSHGSAAQAFSPVLTIDDAPPAFDPSTVVESTSPHNLCQENSAGDVITVGLTKGDVVDTDRMYPPLGCADAEQLTYTWKIIAPDGTDAYLTPEVGGGCAARAADSGTSLVVSSAQDQVCLHTSTAPASGITGYQLQLDVFDGHSHAYSPLASIPVSPDQAPCITSVEPIAGSYAVDRAQPQRFTVGSVADDHDTLSSMHFDWSVWRDSDPVWRHVPDYDLSSYVLDASGFGVGEKVRVRVEALDGVEWLDTTRPATCNVDADACVVDSCNAPPGTCEKWKTWDLELR